MSDSDFHSISCRCCLYLLRDQIYPIFEFIKIDPDREKLLRARHLSNRISSLEFRSIGPFLSLILQVLHIVLNIE